MALDRATGTLAIPGSTGNVSVTGLSFQPKALLVWSSYMTADGVADGGGRFDLGFAADDGGTLTQGYLGSHSVDNVATSGAGSGLNTTAMLKGFIAVSGGVPTVDYEVDFVSFNADGFTVNVANAPTTANIRMHYLALGGSDITKARVFSFNYNATTPQDVTINAGFGQPDVLFLTHRDADTHPTVLGDGQADAYWELGAGRKNAGTPETAYSYMGSDEGTGTQQVWTYQKPGAMISGVNNVPPITYEGNLAAEAGWPTDGFEMVKSPNLAGLNIPVIGLAIQGSLLCKIGVHSSSTTPGANTDFAAGFTPDAMLAFGNNQLTGAALREADSAGTVLGAWGIGAYDGSNENWAGLTDDDAAATSNTGSSSSTSKGWRSMDPGTPPVVAGEADVTFNGTDVRFTWTDGDTAVREFIVVAFGSSGPPPAPTFVSKVGHFAAPGSTGNMSVTGLGFEPKAVMFWSCGATATGLADGGARYSIGWFTTDDGGLQQNHLGHRQLDNVASANPIKSYNTNAALRSHDGAAVLDYEMLGVSMDADGFTVNWTDLPAAAGMIVNYMAFGGEDLEGARCATEYLNTTGQGLNNDVAMPAGWGHPEAVIMLGARLTSVFNGASQFSSITFGAATRETPTGFCYSLYEQSGGTHDVRARSDAKLSFGDPAQASPDVTLEPDESLWPEDGFRMVQTSEAASSYLHFYLALKGKFRARVHGMGVIASPGAATIPVDMEVKAAVAFGGNTGFASSTPFSSDPTDQVLGTFGLGAWDGASERFAAMTTDDAVATMNVGTSQSNTKGYQIVDSSAAGAPVLNAEADISAAPGKRIQMDWTDAPNVNTYSVGLLLFGEAAHEAPGGMFAPQLPLKMWF